MRHADQLMVFSLGERRYALSLPAVERVVRAVDITPLPKAPDIVHGVINVQGRVVPVFNVRRRFRLPEREIAPGDQIVVARSGARLVALVVDAAIGVIECPAQRMVAGDAILPGLEHVKGVAKLEDGLILIHDLNQFLSLEETTALDQAMESG